MENKNNIYIGTLNGKVKLEKGSQLDKIEKKVDKVLELLKEKDSSTSLEIDEKLDDFIKCNHERVLRSNRQDYGI